MHPSRKKHQIGQSPTTEEFLLRPIIENRKKLQSLTLYQSGDVYLKSYNLHINIKKQAPNSV